MNALEFFTLYETFTRNLNYVVQAVKNNNGSAPLFTNTQKAAVIAAADTAIDSLNTMRTEVYNFAGFTQTFPSYNDAAAGNTAIFTPTYLDVNSLRESLSVLTEAVLQAVTRNQGASIADSYLNVPTWTKSGTYLTAEAAAITAIAGINTGLFV